MTRPSDQDFIDANNAVWFQNTTVAPAGLTPFVLNNQSAFEHLSDGFYAQAYLAGPNNVIIAFQGSSLDLLDISSFGKNSKLADAKLAIGLAPQALQDAINFAKEVVSEVTALRASNLLSGGAPSFYVTGHSLGGTEAEAVAKELGSTIVGGVTFGATGLPGYYGNGEGLSLTNYVNYGDPVGNYAHDAEFSDISLTGNHFGTLTYRGNELAKYDIQFVDKTLFAAAVLGEEYVAALAGVLGPELYFHQLSIYASALGINIIGPTPPAIAYSDLHLTSNVVLTAVPTISAKTQPSTSPLPPPSGGFSISGPGSVHENDGVITFTIHRTSFTQAATVYVSTVHDQGFDNPNANFYYSGLLNKQVTFAAGAATAQVQLIINDQHLPTGSEAFRLMVQQNAIDPIGTYLASTTFTIVNNDAGIVANASVNEPTNTTFLLKPFLSLPAPPSGTTISLVNFINTHTGPGQLTIGGVITPGNTAVAYPNVDQVGFSTGSVTGSDKIEMYATYSDGRVSNTVDLTVNIQASPLPPPPPPQTSSGPVVNSNVQPLQVVVGRQGSFSVSNLSASDSAYPDPSQITYNISGYPTLGTILNNGQSAHSFTQADINAGRVSYQVAMQVGLSSEVTDTMIYTVSDPSFRQSSPTAASLKIEPLPPPPQTSQPYVDTNSFPLVREGSQIFVLGTDSPGGSSNLHVTDNNPNIPYTGSSKDSVIVYTVVQGPVHGKLVWFTDYPTPWLPGQSPYFGTQVTKFTQNDLHNGWFVYQNDFTSGAADSFAFTVSDGFGGTIGLTTANIPIQPVNPLILRIDAGAFVVPHGHSTIESHWLFAEDFAPNAYPNAAPLFSVIQEPLHGTLLVSGQPASTFTQLDVTRGLVTYNQDGSTATSDQFTLSVVNDAYGNTISNIVVPITIASNALNLNTGGVVNVGQSLTIGGSNLHVMAPGLGSGNTQAETPTNVVYTIATSPRHGVLSVNGVALAQGSQFTQDQLDKNLLIYAEDGSTATSDSFVFSISDVFGHDFGSSTFSITIANAIGGRIFSGGSTPQIFYSGAGNNWVQGGTGTIVSYELAPAAVSVNLSSSTAANGFGGSDTLSNIHSVVGSSHDDNIVGSNSSDAVVGGPGNDYLIGLDGNDTLIDGSGLNTLQGGRSDDTYAVQSNDDTVFEFANEGTDQVQTFLSSYRLSTNVENLTFVGANEHTGIGNELNNVLIGGPGNDYLIGLDGNDTLIDGSGLNTLQGGKGDDIYAVQSNTDTVFEFANEGTDQVQTFLSSYTLSPNVENLTFVGSNDHIGLANELANVLTGNVGNDTLDGGIGASDTLIGGAGKDTYIVHNVGDLVIENLNGGTDTVVVSSLSSWVLAANVENLTHTSSNSFTGVGNSLNNVLIGGPGNDYLIGLDGNDTLIDGSGLNTLQGGKGDDIYAVQSNTDTVFEFANEGTDQVQTFLASYVLSPNVENLTFIGSNAHAGTGNDQANVLLGKAGNDVLNGLTGNDLLTGGGGADQFVFSTAVAGGNNVDTITDFTVNVDKIVLDHSIFMAAGATGPLAGASFTSGAETASSRIVYDANTGHLSYDADGSAAGAAIQFAIVTPHLNLSTNDFLIV